MDTFANDSAEPLGLWTGPGEPPPLAPELRAELIEFSSRGDRVPGHIWLPRESGGPRPTVLLQHGLNGSRSVDYIGFAAAPWVRAGAAVVTIDFPLHGDRTSPKMRDQLLMGLGLAGKPTATSRALVIEAVRQAVVDLRRTVDVIEQHPELDVSRFAYAGLSLGGIIGTTFCAVDPRPRAAALALAGGGFGGPGLDPCLVVADIAPRPLLFLNMRSDQTIRPSSTEKLFEAASEPKEIHWYDGDHRELPGRAFKRMWAFLSRHIGLDAT